MKRLNSVSTGGRKEKRGLDKSLAIRLWSDIILGQLGKELEEGTQCNKEILANSIDHNISR